MFHQALAPCGDRAIGCYETARADERVRVVYKDASSCFSLTRYTITHSYLYFEKMSENGSSPLSPDPAEPSVNGPTSPAQPLPLPSFKYWRDQSGRLASVAVSRSRSPLAKLTKQSVSLDEVDQAFDELDQEQQLSRCEFD